MNDFTVKDLVAHSLRKEMFDVAGRSQRNVLYFYLVSTAYPQANGVTTPEKGLWLEAVDGSLRELKLDIDVKISVFMRGGNYAMDVKFLESSGVEQNRTSVKVYLFGTTLQANDAMGIANHLTKLTLQ